MSAKKAKTYTDTGRTKGLNDLSRSEFWGLVDIVRKKLGNVFTEAQFLAFSEDYVEFQKASGNTRPCKDPAASMKSNILRKLVEYGYLNVSGNDKRKEREEEEEEEEEDEDEERKRPKMDQVPLLEHVIENKSGSIRVVNSDDTFTITITTKKKDRPREHLEPFKLPPVVLDDLEDEFGFTKRRPLLSVDWTGERILVIPDLGYEGVHVKKLSETNCPVGVAIVPAFLETDWFNSYVLGKAEVRCIKGKISSTPYPLIIIVYRKAKNGSLVLPGPLRFQIFDVECQLSQDLTSTCLKSIMSDYPELWKKSTLYSDLPDVEAINFDGSLPEYSPDALVFGCPHIAVAAEYVNRCSLFSDNIFVILQRGTTVTSDTFMKRSFRVLNDDLELAHFQRGQGWRFVNESESIVSGDIAVSRNAKVVEYASEDTNFGVNYVVRARTGLFLHILRSKITPNARAEPYNMEDMTKLIVEALAE